MAETPQIYLELESGGSRAVTGLRGVINFLRDDASSQYRVGNEFERLIKRYLRVDPLYKERFSDVWLWKEWTAGHTDFDATDIEIDLVAQENSGEYCAIQCKCYAEDTHVTKPQIDSFIAASDNKRFARRMLVHTGWKLEPNVLRTIKPMGSDFQVIDYGHLTSRPIDWPDLRQQHPELLDFRHEPYSLRPHQREASDDVVEGFKDSARGVLIMACGTGKTFAALRIAEEVAGIGGRVLFLVPSIGLFSQAMREWAEQQGIRHRYIGICSDERAGKNAADVAIQKLEIPVITDPMKISESLQKTDEDVMTVVFCTYHSLPLVEQAQDRGSPAFDLILCDEAHRTTGVEHPGVRTSPFLLVHNQERIRAKKRLYMTATPRLFTERQKANAARHNTELFSMDDPATYGPAFHLPPFSKVVLRIKNLLSNPDNELLRDRFDSFHNELKNSINDSISKDDAVDMMGQHLLTRPMFNALFENYDFASRNPAVKALDSLKRDFGEFGLEEETRDLRDLDGFYVSIRRGASGIDDAEGRQKILLELYEKYFTTIKKEDSVKIDIAYTPVEIVDFILHSADEVLRKEFGRSLSDEGVHILDPFAGVGTFLARLVQSDLIRNTDLERKYSHELHANEIVLLAYYMAAANIEKAYRGRCGEESGNEPFDGIVLTDTFNSNEWQPRLDRSWMPENNARAERQQNLPIQVIVGNPLWAAKERRSASHKYNVRYPVLEGRVRETYSQPSTGKLTLNPYDTHNKAIRWASDRIKGQGVIAFVTNGSWFVRADTAGIRACLQKEFSSIYVLNLRGNSVVYGGRGRAEGANVFGQGTLEPVAITILVKNPNSDGCRIHYRDIGDHLSRDEKLAAVDKAVTISGFGDWQTITPDRHYDWVEQRSNVFAKFYPIKSGYTQTEKVDDAIFGLYSRGLMTGRDSYLYNFSRDACAEGGRRMTADYLAALTATEENPELTADEAAHYHSSNLKWDWELKHNLNRQKKRILRSTTSGKCCTGRSWRRIVTLITLL